MPDTLHPIRLHIQILGGVRVSRADASEPLSEVKLRQPRVQALLAYLILHAEAPQPRAHVAACFWPDIGDANAQTNLRTLLYRLRQALPGPDRFLRLTAHDVQWRADAPAVVDALVFADALRRADAASSPSAALAALREAVESYGGDLLPGFYDDWVLAARERLHAQQATALARLADALEAQRDYAAALGYAQHLLRHDPLAEASYRRLMRLHLLADDRAAALRVYHECVAVLRAELDAPPAPATEALHRRLLRLDEQGEGEPDAPAPALAPVPLVGRHAEWQQLLHAWQPPAGSRRSRARLVLIAGEAGIGKSRLAEELADKLRRQGFVTLYTRAYAAHGAAAYAPVADLLRTPPVRAALATLEPVWRLEAARLLPELLPETTTPPPPLVEAWQQQRFYAALARACVAAGEPLLLHVDDVQWCDAETLAWLHFLLRFEPQAKVLVVATVRSEEVDEDHELSKLLPGWRRDGLVEEVHLPPLTAEETAELAQRVTGQALDEAAQARLFRATEGNPLFVVETARAGEPTRGGEAGSEAALPPKVQGVIQARLALLSPEAQRLAGLAAVMGRSFTYEALALAHGEEGEAALLDQLDELWRRQIVREREGNRYDFSHDRIREAAYMGLSRARRRVLHRRVAAALERLHEGRLDEVSGVVAEHYEQAGDREQAIAYFIRAGESATRTSLVTAVEYVTRALALIPTTEHATRAQLFLHRGRLAQPLGRSDLGRSALESVLYELGHLEDSPAKTALLAETSIVFSSIERETGNYPAAVSHAQEGLILAQREPGLPNLIGEAYFQWGMAVWRQGKMMEAQVQLTQALRWAREAGNETMEARILNNLVATGMFSGMPDAEILEYLYACLEILERTGDLHILADTYMKLGYVLLTQGTGRYEQAFEYHRKALALCAELGDRTTIRGALRSLGTLSVVVGDYVSAKSQLSQAMATSQETNDTFGEGIAWNLIGYLRYNIGDIEQAREYQEKSLNLLESIHSRQRMGKTWSALSQVHYALGDYGQSLAYAERSVELGREMGEAREEAHALTCLGYAQIGLGQLGDACASFERAYELRHNLGQTNRSMEPLAGLAHVALVERDTPRMRARIEPIFDHIRNQVMDKTEDTFQVYRVCYQVLAALDDARAGEALRIAHDHLTQRAASLTPDEERIFWSVPGHEEIMRAAAQRHIH